MREREHEIFSEVENTSSLRLFVSNVSVEHDCWEPDNDATFCENYTNGWLNACKAKHSSKTCSRYDQLKFNFWMQANKYRKSHLNNLPWILIPGVHHFLLDNLCLAERNGFGFLPRFPYSPPLSSLVRAAHYFPPVASAAQLCHFTSGYRRSLK